MKRMILACPYPEVNMVISNIVWEASRGVPLPYFALKKPRGL
jgi:hypothetical protein